ncbi:hypothetical protein VB715_12560 [Crocosphaera sp. UHCC 0190]|uniref:hypothetical protein n=1 Tax=Crocosphaera sp. UHCC 0190 TaxID=3110246 RepID=UPI002B20A0A4|nr:hypothetical protein [Crocosphaera sp. UHCC 0190]MEA5510597.1 hypothetical protein [Crocosphaera sp. UHCC 0190]
MTLTTPHKVFFNFSLIMLGVCANGAFFSIMATLLVGTAILGFLKNQPERVLLTHDQTLKGEEKLPVTRF